MLHRRSIDGWPVSMKDIHQVLVEQSPIFTGIDGNPPRLLVEIEDGKPRIIGRTLADGEELKENENWQNIDWTFLDRKDYQKHQREDRNNQLYYVIGCTNIFDNSGNIIGINPYVLKKGCEKQCKNYCYRHSRWWVILDFYLENWQILIFTIVGALIGAGVSVIGNILIEVIKHYWNKSP